MYFSEERGAENDAGYRMFLYDEQGPVSPLHDIPLRAMTGGFFNAVVRSPRWSNHRMEICVREKLNPIMQMQRKGHVKYIPNCFPYHGFMWNVCSLPQTWSNPDQGDPSTGLRGCNTPLEVLEIGYRRPPRGTVLQVKILGSIALIEDHQCKWKVIAIDIEDPVAAFAEDIADVEKFFPDLLKRSVDWLRAYRAPEGRAENRFAFEGEARGASATQELVIDAQHASWKALVDMDVYAPLVSCVNTRIEGSPCCVRSEEASNIIKRAPIYMGKNPISARVNCWNFYPQIHRP